MLSKDLLPCLFIINCQRKDCGNMKKNESDWFLWQHMAIFYAWREVTLVISWQVYSVVHGSSVRGHGDRNMRCALNYSKNEYISQHLLIIHYILLGLSYRKLWILSMVHRKTTDMPRWGRPAKTDDGLITF